MMTVDIMRAVMERQLELQTKHFGVDVTELQGVERANYVQAMALALNIEVGEALQEIAWKPWATSDHFHREAYLMELIDVLHFWMNLVLVATDDPEVLHDVYMRKAYENERRQREGYSGNDKCPECGR